MKQDLRRLLDVADIADPPIEEAIKDYIPTSHTQETIPAPPAEVEQSRFNMFTMGSSDRVLMTFIEVEGYPVLRVSVMTKNADTKVQDLILNNDQIKLLLRQMTLWLTR